MGRGLNRLCCALISSRKPKAWRKRMHAIYRLRMPTSTAATTGKSLAGGTGNRINRRFGVFPDEKSLHGFYRDALKEAYRVLKPGGVLIFKCQDKTSSGKQFFSHCFIWQAAIDAGFYPLDLFILLAKSRLVADWQRVNQKHARKYNAFFWVFQKSNKHIEYTEGTI